MQWEEIQNKLKQKGGKLKCSRGFNELYGKVPHIIVMDGEFIVCWGIQSLSLKMIPKKFESS